MIDPRIKLLVILALITAYFIWKFYKKRQVKAVPETLTYEMDTSLSTEDMLNAALEHIEFYQTLNIENYHLHSYDRRFIDQEAGTLTFYLNDVPKVRADIQIIGSHSADTETWRWSLHDKSIADVCTNKLNPFWDVLRRMDSEWHLDTPNVKVDDEFLTNVAALSVFMLSGQGHEVAALSVFTSSGQGYDVKPADSRDVYVVITDINWID